MCVHRNLFVCDPMSEHDFFFWGGGGVGGGSTRMHIKKSVVRRWANINALFCSSFVPKDNTVIS